MDSDSLTGNPLETWQVNTTRPDLVQIDRAEAYVLGKVSLGGRVSQPHPLCKIQPGEINLQLRTAALCPWLRTGKLFPTSATP